MTVWGVASGIQEAPCKSVFLTESQIRMKVHSLELISSQDSNIDDSLCFLNRVQVLSCWGFEWDLSDTRVHSWAEFYSCAVGIGGECRKALCNAGLWKSIGFTEEETLIWQMKQHCEHYC